MMNETWMCVYVQQRDKFFLVWIPFSINKGLNAVIILNLIFIKLLLPVFSMNHDICVHARWRKELFLSRL
uniref:Uncharacterized protein n=1 Tax=Arundo donax TaxID=35708 RepID=A0A0A9EJX8_ARUDO